VCPALAPVHLCFRATESLDKPAPTGGTHEGLAGSGEVGFLAWKGLDTQTTNKKSHNR